jgi:N-acyl-D-amino-acid deacylase
VKASQPVVIRGGTVVDGTGSPGERRDLVLSGGVVAASSEVPRDAVELDASGCIVAPGFIDIHTHYDAQVFWDPDLSPSCFHGVTTVVAGNCGFSLAPTRPQHRAVIAHTLENVEDMDFACLEAGVPWDFETFGEYLEAVERRGTTLNYAAYVGHTPLRLYVMGDDAYHRTATEEEVVAMQDVLASSLEAGAAGLATSFAITHRGLDGMPIPSRVADKAEFLALLDVMRRWGRGVVGVTSGEEWTFDELYELQPKIGVPFTYGALLSMPSGEHRRRLEVHAAGIAAGADVWPQVSPRPLTFAFRMDDPFPLNACDTFGELMRGSVDDRRRAYADPEWRRRTQAVTDAMSVARPRWDTYTIGESEVHPELEGMSLVQLAEDRGTTPLGALLDLAAGEVTMWVRAVAANDEVDEVAILLKAAHCALGLSDAGAHVGQLCDAPQATDFLGRWVRERDLMSIEEAVRRLTSAQADLFGFADRGRLVPGACADVVVFDPATVAPGPIRRVRDFPAGAERLTAPDPVGVRHVIVNGVPIRVDGEQLDVSSNRPGSILKPATRSTTVAVA